MRATGGDDVVFDKVELPAHHAVDLRPPEDWKAEPLQVVWNAVLLSAVYDGVARATRD